MRHPAFYYTPDLTFPKWITHAADLARKHDDGTTEGEQDCLDRLAAEQGLYGADPALIIELLEEDDYHNFND